MPIYIWLTRGLSYSGYWPEDNAIHINSDAEAYNYNSTPAVFGPLTLGHELGHAALGHSETTHARLWCEIEAWLWLLNRRSAPTAEEARIITQALDYYAGLHPEDAKGQRAWSILRPALT